MYLLVNLPLEGLTGAPKPLDQAEFKRTTALFKFLAKWDCSSSLTDIVKYNVKTTAVATGDGAMLLFVVGAHLDDHDICRDAITEWQRLGIHPSPSAWPFWIWQRVPTPYLAALVGACSHNRQPGHHDPTRINLARNIFRRCAGDPLPS
jgi:hypothetical protein